MTDGKWDIWTSVQSPGGARDESLKRLTDKLVALVAEQSLRLGID